MISSLKQSHCTLGNVYCKYSLLDVNAPVIVTFSSRGGWVDGENKNSDSVVWGYDYILSKGLNVVSFACIDNNSWYSDQGFHDSIEELALVLSEFPKRYGYGGSMGAFAVGAFADALNLDESLLINPISTLLPCLAPFETRFQADRETSIWDTPYSDSALNKKKGYIVYDSLFDLDKLHALRYSSKYVHLKLTGVGHKMPRHLLNLDMLDWLFSSFVSGHISEKEFYSKSKARRHYTGYYQWMMGPQNKYLTKARLKVLSKYYARHRIDNGAVYSVDDKQLNLIRDVAIKISDIDPASAIKLLSLVKDARPTGKLVSSRLSKLKKDTQ